MKRFYTTIKNFNRFTTPIVYLRLFRVISILAILINLIISVAYNTSPKIILINCLAH